MLPEWKGRKIDYTLRWEVSPNLKIVDEKGATYYFRKDLIWSTDVSVLKHAIAAQEVSTINLALPGATVNMFLNWCVRSAVALNDRGSNMAILSDLLRMAHMYDSSTLTKDALQCINQYRLNLDDVAYLEPTFNDCEIPPRQLAKMWMTGGCYAIPQITSRVPSARFWKACVDIGVYDIPYETAACVILPKAWSGSEEDKRIMTTLINYNTVPRMAKSVRIMIRSVLAKVHASSASESYKATFTRILCLSLLSDGRERERGFDV